MQPFFICGSITHMNKWYVITGAPCSGKTTVLRELADRGYSVMPETARTYIDESISQGVSVETIRADEITFQREVLLRKKNNEQSLPQDQIFFFDRGIPDSYAYFRFLGVTDQQLLKESLSGIYRKVFLLDPASYKKDYARTESAEDQIVLDKLLQEAYEKANIPVVRVPIFPTKPERVNFILANL